SKQQYLEFAGNLIPITKSGEQLSLNFVAFRKNRLPFTVRVRDPHQDPIDLPEAEVTSIKSQGPRNEKDQALKMLQLWQHKAGPEKATGNTLEKALHAIKRDDVVIKCMRNVEYTRDSLERAINEIGADQKGFDTLKEECGSSRGGSTVASTGHDVCLDISHEEIDIMKDGESMEDSEGESSPGKERQPRQGTLKAIAAQKFLDFLEEDDREESEERAFNRAKPPIRRNVRNNRNNGDYTKHEPSESNTEVKTIESIDVSKNGRITHTITQVTKTTNFEEPYQTREVIQQQHHSPNEHMKLYESETWQ
ncbi:titin-like isoform X7, partial [Dinothrombium tinctorium]